MPALPPGGPFGALPEHHLGAPGGPDLMSPPIPRPYLELPPGDECLELLAPDEFTSFDGHRGGGGGCPPGLSVPVNFPRPYLEQEGSDQVPLERGSRFGGGPFIEIPAERDSNQSDEGGPSFQIMVDAEEGGLSPTNSSRDGSGTDDCSPTSCRSTGSSAEFYRPDQTIMLFDWDDTLCPSTYCMATLQLGVFDPVPEALRPIMNKLAENAQQVLELANGLGKVVIVTNAEEGWVELSCTNWLPSLLPTVQAVATIVSARSTWEPQGVCSPAGWKQHAFQAEIERFYARYPHQSWKNILSVGDAPHEREALLRVTNARAGAKCRPKSIKFGVRPTLEQLVQELDTLLTNLKDVVYHNGRLDLQFDGEIGDRW